MKILIVGAHPDDETFGMGGTLARHVAEGDEVFVLIFTDGVRARHDEATQKTYVDRQRAQFIRAMQIYGVKDYQHMGCYDDQQLDIVPVVRLAKDVENVIRNFQPERIYTHSAADVGQDHRRVCEAVMIASRPLHDSPVRSVLSFYCPSSTPWGDLSFRPNYFVTVTQYLNIKLSALIGAYPHETPSQAHPRSVAAIQCHMSDIASRIGVVGYAEEFELIRNVV